MDEGRVTGDKEAIFHSRGGGRGRRGAGGRSPAFSLEFPAKRASRDWRRPPRGGMINGHLGPRAEGVLVNTSTRASSGFLGAARAPSRGRSGSALLAGEVSSVFDAFEGRITQPAPRPRAPRDRPHVPTTRLVHLTCKQTFNCSPVLCPFVIAASCHAADRRFSPIRYNNTAFLLS